MGVSQSTVHSIVQMHHDAYMRQIEEANSDISGQQLFNSHEDITLLVRNFNFPMPNAIQKKSNQVNSRKTLKIILFLT